MEIRPAFRTLPISGICSIATVAGITGDPRQVRRMQCRSQDGAGPRASAMACTALCSARIRNVASRFPSNAGAGIRTAMAGLALRCAQVIELGTRESAERLVAGVARRSHRKTCQHTVYRCSR